MLFSIDERPAAAGELSGTADDLDAFRPGVDGEWDRAAVAHLLRRATTGAPAGRVEALASLSPDQAVASLFEGLETPLDADPETLESVRSVGSLEGVQGWWIRELLSGPSGLREKLALFWHGHFATSAEKVDRHRLMLDQIQLFRRRGAGPFEELVQAVSRDPAMVVWLDGNSNRRGEPNENYARELMELFTLGIGNYTEKDIQEAARAFTGWHVKRGRFWFNENAHDTGEKTLFGQGGLESGDDVVRACVRRPASARYIAGKLFRFYVHPRPDAALVDHLGEAFVASERHVGRFLGTLFRSRIFYRESARRALIASPVDFAVGAVRTLGARVASTPLVEHLARMGQEPLRPPSVKGWDGGRTWVGTTGLIARLRFCLALARESDDLRARVPWDELGLEGDESARLPALLDRLFPGEDVANLLASLGEVASRARREELLALCLQLPEAHTV